LPALACWYHWVTLIFMKNTAFVYIHGVHPNIKKPATPGYSKVMHARLLKYFKQKGVVTTGIKRFEINWSQITFNYKTELSRYQFAANALKGFSRRPGKILLRNLLKNFVYPFAVDILFYVKNKGSFDQPGDMVILKKLHETLKAVKSQGYKDVIIFAHSLGSVATYDYVFRFRKRYMFPKSLHLKALVTFGSPIALFAASMGYPISTKIERPDYIEKWYNFWDHDDPIATRLEPHYLKDFRKGFLKDVHVNTSSWNPVAAHTAYWTRPTVIKQIAAEISH